MLHFWEESKATKFRSVAEDKNKENTDAALAFDFKRFNGGYILRKFKILWDDSRYSEYSLEIGVLSYLRILKVVLFKRENSE